MKKRILSMLVLLGMCFSLFLPVSAAAAEGNYDVISGKNIVFAEDDAENRENASYSQSDIVVLSEEQLVSLGNDVKTLASSVEMVYIESSMSEYAIKNICGITTAVNSVDENFGSRIATAVLFINGEYEIHPVEKLIASNEPNAAIDSVLPSDVRTISRNEAAYDGISAILKTNETPIEENATRMQATGFAAHAIKSAVVYDNSNSRIGTMGFTVYFYNRGKATSGTGRLFDSICVATFAPDNGYACADMSVFLGTTRTGHSVLEAANIISNGQTHTHSLGLSAAKTGVSGTVGTSWNYTVDAQTVTKSFDMTTNDREWTFKPTSAGNGDAWIEEPGIRTYSTGTACYTSVELNCPYVTIFGIQLQSNSLSGTYYYTYS